MGRRKKLDDFEKKGGYVYAMIWKTAKTSYGE